MTTEKFKLYVGIQESGLTNMFDINTVIRLSNYRLTREDCTDIMQNYEKYEEEFGDLEEDLEPADFSGATYFGNNER